MLFHLCLLPVRDGVSFLLQEKKEFEQKLAKEQGSLREQLQVCGAEVSLPPPRKRFLPSSSAPLCLLSQRFTFKP